MMLVIARKAGFNELQKEKFFVDRRDRGSRVPIFGLRSPCSRTGFRWAKSST
jgi:hypothetical protein